MNPTHTKDVAECFPQYILLLLSMAIPTDSVESTTEHSSIVIHRLNCVILGQLISINPDALG